MYSFGRDGLEVLAEMLEWECLGIDWLSEGSVIPGWRLVDGLTFRSQMTTKGKERERESKEEAWTEREKKGKERKVRVFSAWSPLLIQRPWTPVCLLTLLPSSFSPNPISSQVHQFCSVCTASQSMVSPAWLGPGSSLGRQIRKAYRWSAVASQRMLSLVVWRN